VSVSASGSAAAASGTDLVFFAIFLKKFFSYIFLPNFLRTLDWKSPERSSLATARLTSTRQLSSHQNI
jgi:hypothetical protein